jgi:hypothetical protein
VLKWKFRRAQKPAMLGVHQTEDDLVRKQSGWCLGTRSPKKRRGSCKERTHERYVSTRAKRCHQLLNNRQMRKLELEMYALNAREQSPIAVRERGELIKRAQKIASAKRCVG